MEYSKKASNCKLLLLDGYYTTQHITKISSVVMAELIFLKTHYIFPLIYFSHISQTYIPDQNMSALHSLLPHATVDLHPDSENNCLQYKQNQSWSPEQHRNKEEAAYR